MKVKLKPGRKALLIKKRQYRLYMYEADVNSVGWDKLSEEFHRLVKRMKKKVKV